MLTRCGGKLRICCANKNRRTPSISCASAALKQLADTEEPLLKSLDDAQSRIGSPRSAVLPVSDVPGQSANVTAGPVRTGPHRCCCSTQRPCSAGKSYSKDTAMHMTRFERMALAKFFVAGWLAFCGVAIEHAQAQIVNPVPPPPPPVFNPSTPYTVPQSPETPVSPGTPSTLPLSSPDGNPPSAAARSHRPAVTSATVTSNVAKARGGRHSHRHHRRKSSRGSHTAGTEGGWGVCGAFESANRCNAEWNPRSHRCGCIVR